MSVEVETEAYEIAYAHARGCYQRALIDGLQRWSGSDLTGRAGKFAGRYAASRVNLRNRLTADRRLYVREVRGPRGLRVVQVGLLTPPVDSVLRLGGDPAELR